MRAVDIHLNGIIQLKLLCFLNQFQLLDEEDYIEEEQEPENPAKRQKLSNNK